mmetsp:Transcript_39112/g.91082  ORF Transcript_39112/g.91082 Transcript_39112/m.91082 type:complete len:121 (+) Transcript_39112:808-1170(+)
MLDLLYQRKAMSRMEAEELPNLVDGGLDALQHRYTDCHDSPPCNPCIREVVYTKTLTSTKKAAASSCPNSPSAEPPTPPPTLPPSENDLISSRLNVASLLLNLHSAAAARITQSWALVPR